MKVLSNIAVFVTSAVLFGSFGFAVVDKNLRDDFGNIAIVGMKTLAVLTKDEKDDKKDDKRNKDQDNGVGLWKAIIAKNDDT